MSIFYCAIARGTTVLTEHSDPTVGYSNVSQFTAQLLPKIQPEDSKKSYQSGQFYLHYIVINKVTYLCVTAKDFSIRIAYGFLYHIQGQFVAMYQDRIQSAIAYGMEEFSRILEKTMVDVKRDPSSVDKIAGIRRNVDETKEILIQNIGQSLPQNRLHSTQMSQFDFFPPSLCQTNLSNVGLNLSS